MQLRFALPAVLSLAAFSAGPALAQRGGGHGGGGGGHGGGHGGGGGGARVSSGHVSGGHVSGGHVSSAHVSGGHVSSAHMSSNWNRNGSWNHNGNWNHNNNFHNNHFHNGNGFWLGVGLGGLWGSPYYYGGGYYPADYYAAPYNYSSLYPPDTYNYNDLLYQQGDPQGGQPNGQQGNLGNQARVQLILPDKDAQVTVEGAKTASLGKTRYFESPPLEQGYKYSYKVAATWMKDGQPVTDVRTVPIFPGRISVVDFTRPPSEPLPPPAKEKSQE